jgi:ZIP family zinc transporter
MDPLLSTIFGLSFIFLMTSLGSSIVFFFARSVNEVIRNSVFGFAGGVMLSAAFWGLLTPAIEEAKSQNLSYPFWIPCVLGFFFGCLLILSLDIILPFFLNHVKTSVKKSDDLKDYDKDKTARAMKLFLAIAIHNIPEGMACGLVFGHGLKASGADQETAIRSAIGLSIGIGLQDIPEGAAVALPVRELTGSVTLGFVLGVLSGLVEPIAGLAALYLTSSLKQFDPWALGFSAGAMIYVTLEELLPEAMSGTKPKCSLWATLIGFIGMTIGEQLV